MTRSGWLLALSLTVSAGAASAESATNEAKAKALFEEGRELIANEQYARACAKFEASLKLAQGIGTTYNLATCEVKLGHFARAHRLFTQAAVASRELGQVERARVADADAQALEARLALVRVELESLEPGRELRLDDEPLSVDSRTATALCDPGKHRLSATTRKQEDWAHDFEAGAGESLTILVPRAPARAVGESAPKAAKAASTAAAASTKAPAPPQPVAATPAQEASSSGAPAMFWVLAGGGVAGLAAGTLFGLRFLKHNNDAKDICPSTYDCTQEELDRHAELVDGAASARRLSFVGFGAGAALTTAAIVVLATHSSSPTSGRRPPPAASFQASRSGFSLAVQGEF